MEEATIVFGKVGEFGAGIVGGWFVHIGHAFRVELCFVLMIIEYTKKAAVSNAQRGEGKAY